MYIVFQYTFMINSGASVDNAMFTCLAATLQYTSLHDNTAFSYFCIGGNNGMDRDDRTEYSVFFIQLFRYIFSDAVELEMQMLLFPILISIGNIRFGS